MKRKEILLLVVLLAIAAGGLVYGTRTPARVPKKPASVFENTTSGPRIRPARKNNEASWGRSPFIFGSLSSESFAGLVLSGIFWDSVKPQAIIGGQIVSVGDVVGPNGTKVEDIRPDKVILNDGKNKVELMLG